MSEKELGKNNKGIVIFSLIVVVIVNMIFNSMFKNMMNELTRLLTNGIHGRVFWFFVGDFLFWFLISSLVFLVTFGMLKGVQTSVREEEENYKIKKKKSEKISKDFEATKQIDNFVAFDNPNKKWATFYNDTPFINAIYDYDDIVNFELLEDGSSVASGGLGRALVGGVLFGGAGAIVGGVTGKRKTENFCDDLKLKITINNIDNSVVYVNFLEDRTKKDSEKFKVVSEQIQETLSILQLICDENKHTKSGNSSQSNVEEIKKYKELLDINAISKEEYETKKNELLNL